MTDLTAVIEKFPAHEFTVRRLHASDTDFKSLCEDYAVAVCASERWKDDHVRGEEYRKLADELEIEILEFIEGRHPRPPAMKNKTKR